jgi:hypothetical protein
MSSPTSVDSLRRLSSGTVELDDVVPQDDTLQDESQLQTEPAANLVALRNNVDKSTLLDSLLAAPLQVKGEKELLIYSE